MAKIALTRNGNQLFLYDESKKDLIDHLLKNKILRKATEQELLNKGYNVSKKQEKDIDEKEAPKKVASEKKSESKQNN